MVAPLTCRVAVMAKWIKREVRYAHYIAEGWNPADGSGLSCVYCERAVVVGAHNSNPAAASLDHVESRFVSGDRYDTRALNLVCCCAGCNSSKKNQDLMVWVAAKFPGRAVAIAQEMTSRLAVKGDMAAWINRSVALGYAARKKGA